VSVRERNNFGPFGVSKTFQKSNINEDVEWYNNDRPCPCWLVFSKIRLVFLSLRFGV
jgi:hypothetical protein